MACPLDFLFKLAVGVVPQSDEGQGAPGSECLTCQACAFSATMIVEPSGHGVLISNSEVMPCASERWRKVQQI